ncbi:MAG TPA: hypothetical protein VGE04_02055 [Chloroflexia bacterium]
MREAPGTDSTVTGSLNTGQKIEVDSVINGEDIQGETKWAHLADGPRFVTMRFLRQV